MDHGEIVKTPDPLERCRGQGMIEYVLVVTVVVAVSVTALSVVTTSCGTLITTMVDQIEDQTGVEAPADEGG